MDGLVKGRGISKTRSPVWVDHSRVVGGKTDLVWVVTSVCQVEFNGTKSGLLRGAVLTQVDVGPSPSAIIRGMACPEEYQPKAVFEVFHFDRPPHLDHLLIRKHGISNPPLICARLVALAGVTSTWVPLDRYCRQSASDRVAPHSDCSEVPPVCMILAKP